MSSKSSYDGCEPVHEFVQTSNNLDVFWTELMKDNDKQIIRPCNCLVTDGRPLSA